MDPGAVLLALLGSAEPRLAPRRLRAVRLDGRGDTVAGPGRGAAVLRVKGTTKALVATTDGNQAVGALDPWLGAALSVAEATRNVSITGARPLGVTNCLNYGDPTRPEAFWQLTEGVRGLADACRALGLPVTGGNVSLYNESPAGRDRADARDRRRRAARRRRDARRAGVRARPATRSCSSARRCPGLAGSRVRARSPAPPPEDGPPALDLAREARAPGVRPRGDRARPRRVGARTSRAAGSRSRSPSARSGAGSGAERPARRRPLAGGRPVRREPVAARRDAPAAPRRRR